MYKSGLANPCLLQFQYRHDWPTVYGIPIWLPALLYNPAKAKALPREGASTLIWFPKPQLLYGKTKENQLLYGSHVHEVVQGQGMRNAEMLVWAGDFNYRIDATYEDAIDHIRCNDLEYLLERVCNRFLLLCNLFLLPCNLFLPLCMR